MYQLVAVGRGEKIEKATLKKSANRHLSELIAQKQKMQKPSLNRWPAHNTGRICWKKRRPRRTRIETRGKSISRLRGRAGIRLRQSQW